MMLNFLYYKYLIKTICYFKKKNYEKVFNYFIKMICQDILPNKKIINYDSWLEKIIDKIIVEKNINIEKTDVSLNNRKELILNTEIYDSGGHTELAIRYIQANPNVPIYFYQTNSFKKDITFFNELSKGKVIEQSVVNYYISDAKTTLVDKIFESFNYIINNKITKIIVNIHMQDAVGCAILYLIKKYTNIEILFWNHGDHWFALGTKYADKIFTRIKNGKPITPYLQDNKKCLAGKFIINYDKSQIMSEDEIVDLRKQLNVPADCFLTMTGCSLQKLNKKYFELINSMLEKNSKIYHLFICPDFPQKEQKIKELLKQNKRVIIIPATPKFEKYIQITDLYIDSFPQGSALTLIDYIKYKKPVVIKINAKDPFRSFEEYLYPNYEYAFKTSKNMLEGILELASNKEKYNEISNKVWNFFEKEYI